MRARKYTKSTSDRSQASAEAVARYSGSASFMPPEGFHAGVSQMYGRWSQDEQEIIERNRPHTSLVDDALMQIYYDSPDAPVSIETILAMNNLTDKFDKQLQLRGILGRIVDESPEGELHTVTREARERLQRVIASDESRLQHEDDYVYSYRKAQLGKGEDILADAGNKDEIALRLESLFPNGIMVCFSIPDSYLSKADAKKKIKSVDQATSFARNKGGTLKKMQEISYTNEAEFLNSAFPYAAAHNAVGLYGSQLKLGIPTLYTSPEEIAIKARSIQQQLAGILGSDHPSTKIRYLAIFSHGGVGNVSGRKSKADWGYTLPTDNTKITKDSLPGLISKLPLTDDVSVRLFACNTARTEGVAKDADAEGTGEGGFSDAFRDELLNQGYDEASVIGHIVAGHTIRNRQQRLFVGGSETSFNIQVSGKILKEILPDSFQQRIDSELHPDKEERGDVLESMIWLYQNESWLIDLPAVSEKSETESVEEYQDKYRKAMFANFFKYWIRRVKENRLILSKKYS